LFFVTRIALRASGDLAALRVRKINSIREFSAITSVVLFSYMSFVQFAFVLVGVLAMLTPPTGPSSRPPTAYGITTAFLLISWVSSGVAFVVDRRRRYLRSMILKAERENAQLEDIMHKEDK
jgi:hypothetical protein